MKSLNLRDSLVLVLRSLLYAVLVQHVKKIGGLLEMKITAVFETSRLEGGGFNQALNAVLQMQHLSKNKFEFSVVTNLFENVQFLVDLGLSTSVCEHSFIDQFLPRLRKLRLSRWIFTRFFPFSRLEMHLQRLDTDLVYFVNPSATPNALQTLNYISTVWDLCHRDFPEFPEVRDSNEFQRRETLYSGTLGASMLTITESEKGARAVAKRYDIDQDRTLSMPLSPSPYMSSSHSLGLDEVMLINNLVPGYYFYPAQLWAHKNHIRIIEAVGLLNQQGIIKQVVFAGGSKGLDTYLKKHIASLNLEKQVKILGFVPNEQMRGLYEGCTAVVMPTYFGPTNIPPLEAWSIGRPLIYSSHLLEQAGDAALLIDPDEVTELVQAMINVLDPIIANDLIVKGFNRLKKIEADRITAELNLLSKLIQFEKRLKCWH
mgnify:CR=1 FL=1